MPQLYIGQSRTTCQFVQQQCIVFVLSEYLFRDVTVEAGISSSKCRRQHWSTSTKETLSAIHFHSKQTSYSSHSGCRISSYCAVTGYFTSCDVTAAWPCERCQLERFVGNGWGYAAAPSGNSWTVRLSWKIFHLRRIFYSERGKNQNFGVRVQFRFIDDKVSLLFGFWVLLKNYVLVRFEFCKPKFLVLCHL